MTFNRRLGEGASAQLLEARPLFTSRQSLILFSPAEMFVQGTAPATIERHMIQIKPKLLFLGSIKRIEALFGRMNK
jgi:hypothetical protein